MRVLLSLYACEPDVGSEPGGGWNWACALALEGCEVVALVPSNLRAVLEEELERRPRPRLHFDFVDFCPGRGWDSHVAYARWQIAVYRHARSLLRHQRFDVVHHVTYGSLTGGSLLGRLGVPFVFGPVGGAQVAEAALAPWFGTAWRSERRRAWYARHARLSPLAQSAIRGASLVLATNRDTEEMAHAMGAVRVERFLDSGLPDDFGSSRVAMGKSDGARRVLWVGSMRPCKGANLSVSAFAAAGLEDAQLIVVGDGPCRKEVEALVDELAIRRHVQFTGRLSWERVQEEYSLADAFLFTSLRDSFGSQILEAMAFGLPSVILDHHAASVLPDDAVRKVPVDEPKPLVTALGRALRDVLDVESSRRSMRRGALDLAARQSWRQRAIRMVELYEGATRT